MPLPENPRPENSTLSPKGQLAIAIARGSSASKWAAANQVPKRTAQKWAREPKVRAEVERIRRRAPDRTVGRMTNGLNWATQGIFDLAKGAASESVKLAALRAVVSDMMAVSKFGGLEDRMTKIEEKLDARTGDTSHAR
jgi:hypothetical protein